MVRNLTRLLTLCNRFVLHDSHTLMHRLWRSHMQAVTSSCARIRHACFKAQPCCCGKCCPLKFAWLVLTCSLLPIMNCFAGQTYLSMLEQTSRC